MRAPICSYERLVELWEAALYAEGTQLALAQLQGDLRAEARALRELAYLRENTPAKVSEREGRFPVGRA